METPWAAKAGPSSRPPTAASISVEVHSGRVSAMAHAQGRAHLGHVVEGMGHGADDLALLVALAGHHQHVTVAKLGHGGLDRLAAVADLRGAGRGGEDGGAD